MVGRGSAERFIFGVVGPSGCGKSAVIDEMLRRFPADLVLMRSLTTRARRPTDEDRTTRFVSQSDFLRLVESGALVQWVEYDGRFYGDASDDVEKILRAGKHAIRPLVEDAIS
jgi:guanylate kinase